MLQAINDRIKGWLGGVVVALISLPFALWGISSYFGGGEAPNAATVGDVKITVQELDFTVAIKKQELRSRYGNELPFEDSMIKQQVLDQLVNQKVLNEYTRETGYLVSDIQLFNNMKSLFNKDGEFDRALFESLKRSRGQTTEQFEEELRDEIRISQFSNGLRATAIVSTAELEQLAKLELQQREISLLKFSVSNQLETVVVSDEEIQAAYDQGVDQFMTPEQVSISYVELTGEQLVSDVKLDEQKIKQAYDHYLAQLAHTEQRKASHILVKPEPDRDTALSKLEEVKQKLTEGQSFASLAKQYSSDSSSADGGDLDWIERGQMVKPFEDALFAMKKSGDVSDVVESQFGLHLIKLDDMRQQKPQSLAEKRNELEADLKREFISGVFYDQSELLATTAYENPDSLDMAAEAIAVSVQQSERMTRATGKGIAANPMIREAAFSGAVLNQHLNSDVIELAPDHVVVLRVNEHIPARKLPLDQVQAVLRRDLQREKALAATMIRARQARDEIRTGKSAGDFLAPGVTLDKPLLVKRNDADKLNPAALRLAFEMAKPDADTVSASETALGNAAVAVVILHKVVSPAKVEQSQLDALRKRRMSDLALAEYEAVLADISSRVSIKKNLKVLE